MNESLLNLLSRVDTPTVCNAIELAQGKRGFNDFTRGHYTVMRSGGAVACGFARTARIAAEQPTTRSDSENKAVRMEYYRYMSAGQRPAVCVIEDTDQPPVGAFWGEVNTTIHKGFGISGTLTNGMIRDFGCCPDGYQVIGGGISPSHRFVHVLDYGKPVTVFGMEAREGDFIHADRNGGCVIPPDILPELERWIAKMQDLEALVIEPAKQPGFTFEAFQAAWTELERQRV